MALAILLVFFGVLLLLPVIKANLGGAGEGALNDALNALNLDNILNSGFNVYNKVQDELLVKPIQDVVMLAEGDLNADTAKTVFIPGESGFKVPYKVKGLVNHTKDSCRMGGFLQPDNKKVIIAGKTLGRGDYAVVKMIANDNGKYDWQCENTREGFRFNRNDAGHEMAICAEWHDHKVKFSSYRYAVGNQPAQGKGHCPISDLGEDALAAMCAQDEQCYNKYLVSSDFVDELPSGVYEYELIKKR